MAVLLSQTEPGVRGEGASTPVVPLREYDAQCPPVEEPSLECEWLRSLVVAEVVGALEAIERSRDQRGVELALKALGVLDEPEVLIAACRILGKFADRPGIAEKVPPLLDSPYLEVQRIAAQLLGRNPNRALAAMGHEWSENHGGATVETPYGELDFPEHYAGMRFPEYPGAERYTPADSDRSIGWWSPDPPATVSSRLVKTLGVEAMTPEQWAERAQQQVAAAARSAFDPAKMAEMQKLTEQYMKTQDPKLMERIEALGKEMAAPMEETAAGLDQAVDRVATPPPSAPYDQIYYLVAEEKGGHVARLILVYRQPVVERTVLQMAWDLRDYPPAWAPKETGG